MTTKNKTTKHVAIDQTFSLNAPGASSVVLVGDFTQRENQTINLHKQAGGLWQVVVAVEPGEYRYRFLVDGEVYEDPDFLIRVPDPFCREDALLEPPSGAVA